MPDERETLAPLIVAGMNLRQYWADCEDYKQMSTMDMIRKSTEMRRRDAKTKREFLAALKQVERPSHD
jgi:hypothetical protein